MGDSNQRLVTIGRALAPREAAYVDGGVGGNFLSATSTSSQRVIIPEWLRGRYVRITAITEDCSVQFGDAAVTCDHTTVSTVGSEAITFSDATGGYIVAGTSLECLIPRTAGFMAFDAAGVGVLNMVPTSEKVDH